MFHARLIASRIPSNLAALLIISSWSGLAAAQSAIPGDQWRAAGSTYSEPAAASNSNGGWRLPNGQSSNGDAQMVDEDSNPLRKDRKPQPAAKPPEPRAFQAPTNAAPMTAAKSTSAATYNGPQSVAQQGNRSAATATRPGTTNAPAYVAQQPQFNRAPANVQRPYIQPNYRPAMSNQNQPSSSNDTIYDAINVAFNGPPAQTQVQPQTQQAPTSRVVKPQGTQMKRSSENLPMPGEGGYEMNDPVMRYPGGPGEFADHLGGNCYQPYCEQGNCEQGNCEQGNCSGDSCSGGCAGPCCGDGCEPGCDCPCGQPCGEPGCDCPGPNCKKDVLCIGPGDDESCHIVQIRWPKWQEVVVFSGVQGFKGPYDRERDSGNFGFNEGFNIGAKVPYCALGYQFGYRATEDQLNGDIDTGIKKEFVQSFVTAGLFHRQKDGLNFGVVWDALVDEREQQNFHQIRSEVSVIGCGCHEFGFGATVGTNTHSLEDPNNQGTFLSYQASDQYVLFYRLHGCNGGEGRVYAGVNNDSDGILGSDMLLPIGGCFSVSGNFSYLIPNQSNGTEGATHEAWNIGLGLVWHWDGQARKCYENCYRPMFNVADNSILIVDQQNQHN
jgi:hypothetical protein